MKPLCNDAYFAATLFKWLTTKEEESMRQWARNNLHLAKNFKDDSILLVHPVIIDEWKKCGVLQIEFGDLDLDYIRKFMKEVLNLELPE